MSQADIVAEVCSRRANGQGIKEIARAIGKRNHFVMDTLRSVGAYAIDDMTKDDQQLIREVYLSGADTKDIAKKFGVPELAVIHFIKNAKLDRDRRDVEIVGDGTARIPLTRGKYAIVDVDDLDVVGRRSWFMTGTDDHPYAATRDSTGPVTLHRLLMRPPKMAHVDHINGDTLDNRRSNLRVVSASENIANSRRRTRIGKSGFLGVKELRSGRFHAYARICGQSISFGTFDTAKEAAEVYDREMTKEFGEHVDTNRRRGLL